MRSLLSSMDNIYPHHETLQRQRSSFSNRQHHCYTDCYSKRSPPFAISLFNSSSLSNRWTPLNWTIGGNRTHGCLCQNKQVLFFFIFILQRYGKIVWTNLPVLSRVSNCLTWIRFTSAFKYFISQLVCVKPQCRLLSCVYNTERGADTKNKKIIRSPSQGKG